MVATSPRTGTDLNLRPPVTSTSFLALTFKIELLRVKTSSASSPILVPFNARVPTVSIVFAVLNVHVV